MLPQVDIHYLNRYSFNILICIEGLCMNIFANCVCTLDCDAVLLQNQGIRSQSVFPASSFLNTAEKINLHLFYYLITSWGNPTLCLLLSCVPSVQSCALFPLQMGQINPSVRLYVVTVDGSSIATELRPPDSLEKRFKVHSLSPSLRGTDHRFNLSPCLTLSVLPQRPLRRHGEVGHPREAERPLGQPGPEHVHLVPLWCHHQRLRQGQRALEWPGRFAPVQELLPGIYSGVCLFVCLSQNLQKHVMTSDKWLDRLVSAGQGF